MVLKAYEYQDLIVYFVVFVYLSLFSWIPQSFLIIIKDFNEFRQSNAQFYNSGFFHFSPDIKNLRITSIHFSSTLSWMANKKKAF